MYKIKEQAIKGGTEAKTVLHNLDRLIEAGSLVLVAGFSYLVVRGNIDPRHLSHSSKYAILGASVVIALRGAAESLRFLSEKK